MENSEMVTIQLSVPKSKVRKLKLILKKEGLEVSQEKPTQTGPYGLRKGNYKPGEKPSDFSGAWAKRKPEERITAEELRKQAWGGRGV